MGEVNTSQWIQFFRNAGLNLNVAANYAIIFYDNRIQLDMLMDLSKEYLFDMGIRVMGDVIAILRHAKEYHNQMVKEKMIGEQPMGTPAPKRNQSSPSTRMLTHYTRPSSVTPRKTTPVTRQGTLSASTIQRRAPVVTAPAKRSLVSLTRTASQNELSVKKARFFQPQEEEKSMLVRMPAGTTDRSRKLLQLQQQIQSAKRSVFDRLGDSHVSSSTDIKFSQNQSSVFRRLGPSSSTEVTSTAGKVDDDEDSGPLQYRGILKKLNTVRTTRTMQKNSSPLAKSPLYPTGKKIIRLNSSSASNTTTTTMKSSIGRRTVVQSARDLQASNVTQINKILAQNTPQQKISLTKANFKPIVGVKNRLTVGNRISLLKKQQQSTVVGQKIITVRGGGKVVSLKNNPASRFALNNRQSVFNRLGKK